MIQAPKGSKYNDDGNDDDYDIGDGYVDNDEDADDDHDHYFLCFKKVTKTWFQ